MKFVKIYLFFLFAIIISLIQGCAFTPRKPPKPAVHIDKPRFLGLWYEIASMPSFSQAGCECTTGDYTEETTSLNNSSIIKVHNKCYDNYQKHYKSVHGTVWITKNTGNAKLKIEFFWPFKNDYWILYADQKNPGNKNLYAKEFWVFPKKERGQIFSCSRVGKFSPLYETHAEVQ